MNLKGLSYLLLFLVVCCAGAFGLGRYTAKPVRILEERTRVDTLILRDTFTHYVPRPVHTHTRDTVRVPLTEVIHDTVWIYLPRETKVYEDSRYRAEISGYQPSLDRIDIFTQTEVVTQATTQTQQKKARWGLGVSAGYGVAIDTKDKTFTPAPYVGIGIHYNIISW